MDSLLTIVHLIGLALGVGAASVKVVLLLKSKSDQSFLPIYVKASKPITQVLVLGLILLTITGIIWILDGYPFSSELIVKIVLVALVWVIGPIIDNVVEPKFKKLAPNSDQPASEEFSAVMKAYLALEIIATAIFYTIIIYWV